MFGLHGIDPVAFAEIFGGLLLAAGAAIGWAYSRRPAQQTAEPQRDTAGV